MHKMFVLYITRYFLKFFKVKETYNTFSVTYRRNISIHSEEIFWMDLETVYFNPVYFPPLYKTGM
jgi:hypothetical protein